MHEDKHKASTLLRIRPLSLQNAGDARVPMGVITLFDWKNSLGAREAGLGRQERYEISLQGLYGRPPSLLMDGDSSIIRA